MIRNVQSAACPLILNPNLKGKCCPCVAGRGGERLRESGLAKRYPINQ